MSRMCVRFLMMEMNDRRRNRISEDNVFKLTGKKDTRAFWWFCIENFYTQANLGDFQETELKMLYTKMIF